MIVRLLSPISDFDAEAPLPDGAETLTRDLDLGTLFDAMAGDDAFLAQTVPKVVLRGLTDPMHVRYRQDVLLDCIAHPDVARALYDVASEVTRAEREAWGFGNRPDTILYRSTRLLRSLLPLLVRVREIAETESPRLQSEGFRAYFAGVRTDLDARFFAATRAHLERLEFAQGMLLSARLGPGNKGDDYRVRTPRPAHRPWPLRWLGSRRSPLSFEIGDRDEAGHRAVADLKAMGVSSTAVTLARSTAHVVRFFALTRAEVGFYLACVALRERLARAGLGVALPHPESSATGTLSAQGLYDPCLALRTHARPVANSLAADGARLVVITGANQGGKTTFLRSVGVGLVMLGAGMFVPADSMSASTGHGIFSHFKRGEDESLQGGKFDEELKRMAWIAPRLRPGAVLLCNESFASTNEREGSEIADQAMRAFLERGVRVLYVTHLFEFGQRVLARGASDILFLRAERAADGRRTYRMEAGPPLSTSFGEDLCRQVFAPDHVEFAAPVTPECPR